MTETPFTNGLTLAQQEMLTILVEECGEVIQAATKILRHGLQSYNPFDEAKVTNQQHLEKEMGHVQFSFGVLINEGTVSQENIVGHTVDKAATINKWLHHFKMNEPSSKGDHE